MLRERPSECRPFGRGRMIIMVVNLPVRADRRERPLRGLPMPAAHFRVPARTAEAQNPAALYECENQRSEMHRERSGENETRLRATAIRSANEIPVSSTSSLQSPVAKNANIAARKCQQRRQYKYDTTHLESMASLRPTIVTDRDPKRFHPILCPHLSARCTPPELAQATGVVHLSSTISITALRRSKRNVP